MRLLRASRSSSTTVSSMAAHNGRRVSACCRLSLRAIMTQTRGCCVAVLRTVPRVVRCALRSRVPLAHSLVSSVCVRRRRRHHLCLFVHFLLCGLYLCLFSFVFVNSLCRPRVFFLFFLSLDHRKVCLKGRSVVNMGTRGRHGHLLSVCCVSFSRVS